MLTGKTTVWWHCDPQRMRHSKIFVLCQYSQQDQRYRHLSASCWTSSLQKLFSQVFTFALVIRITWKKKTDQGMDLPVYKESDYANFILVED